MFKLFLTDEEMERICLKSTNYARLKGEHNFTIALDKLKAFCYSSCKRIHSACKTKKCIGHKKKTDIICLSRSWWLKMSLKNAKNTYTWVTTTTLIWLIGSLKSAHCSIQTTNNAYEITSQLCISVLTSQLCHILADMVLCNIFMGN